MDRGSDTAVLEGRTGLALDSAFFAASAPLFLASSAGTIWWCGSMAGGMAMPGGWTMSMAWMPMPGQTWFVAVASFLGMWAVMMVAMMLPSLAPTLANYRRSLRRAGQNRLGTKTALAAAGYFLVWTAFGAVAYPFGVLLAAAEMRWPTLARTAPIATGIVLLLAGCFQLTAWKSRQLGCCRVTPECGHALAPQAWSAIKHGIRLGVHCVFCCCGFTMILFVIGVMNVYAITIVAVAITLERLMPRPERVAQATGALVIAAGAFLITRALGVI